MTFLSVAFLNALSRSKRPKTILLSPTKKQLQMTSLTYQKSAPNRQTICPRAKMPICYPTIFGSNRCHRQLCKAPQMKKAYSSSQPTITTRTTTRTLSSLIQTITLVPFIRPQALTPCQIAALAMGLMRQRNPLASSIIIQVT